jgi:hypothetical protein
MVTGRMWLLLSLVADVTQKQSWGGGVADIYSVPGILHTRTPGSMRLNCRSRFPWPEKSRVEKPRIQSYLHPPGKQEPFIY